MQMKRKNKILLSVCAVVLLLAGLITVVFARYVKNAMEITNTFDPSVSVTPVVKETFQNGVRSDVYFEVGKTEYPVYVRAAIIINWKQDDNESVPTGSHKGDVFYSKPVEGVLISETDSSVDNSQDKYSGDYLMELNLVEDNGQPGWVFDATDGFYYYVNYVDSDIELQYVDSNGVTANLIDSFRQINEDTAPDGFVLSVEIIVQTVQALGDTDGNPTTAPIPAYKDAWNY